MCIYTIIINIDEYRMKFANYSIRNNRKLAENSNLNQNMDIHIRICDINRNHQMIIPKFIIK